MIFAYMDGKNRDTASILAEGQSAHASQDYAQPNVSETTVSIVVQVIQTPSCPYLLMITSFTNGKRALAVVTKEEAIMKITQNCTTYPVLMCRLLSEKACTCEKCGFCFKL